MWEACTVCGSFLCEFCVAPLRRGSVLCLSRAGLRRLGGPGSADLVLLESTARAICYSLTT